MTNLKKYLFFLFYNLEFFGKTINENNQKETINEISITGDKEENQIIKYYPLILSSVLEFFIYSKTPNKKDWEKQLEKKNKEQEIKLNELENQLKKKEEEIKKEKLKKPNKNEKDEKNEKRIFLKTNTEAELLKNKKKKLEKELKLEKSQHDKVKCEKERMENYFHSEKERMEDCFRKKLSEKFSEIERQDEQMKYIKSHLENLAKEMEKKNSEIKNLAKEMEEKNSEIKNLTKDLEEKKSEIEKDKEHIEKLKEKIKDLEKKLEETENLKKDISYISENLSLYQNKIKEKNNSNNLNSISEDNIDSFLNEAENENTILVEAEKTIKKTKEILNFYYESLNDLKKKIEEEKKESEEFFLKMKVSKTNERDKDEEKVIKPKEEINFDLIDIEDIEEKSKKILDEVLKYIEDNKEVLSKENSINIETEEIQELREKEKKNNYLYTKNYNNYDNNNYELEELQKETDEFKKDCKKVGEQKLKEEIENFLEKMELVKTEINKIKTTTIKNISFKEDSNIKNFIIQDIYKTQLKTIYPFYEWITSNKTSSSFFKNLNIILQKENFTDDDFKNLLEMKDHNKLFEDFTKPESIKNIFNVEKINKIDTLTKIKHELKLQKNQQEVDRIAKIKKLSKERQKEEFKNEIEKIIKTYYSKETMEKNINEKKILEKKVEEYEEKKKDLKCDYNHLHLEYKVTSNKNLNTSNVQSSLSTFYSENLPSKNPPERYEVALENYNKENETTIESYNMYFHQYEHEIKKKENEENEENEVREKYKEIEDSLTIIREYIDSIESWKTMETELTSLKKQIENQKNIEKKTDEYIANILKESKNAETCHNKLKENRENAIIIKILTEAEKEKEEADKKKVEDEKRKALEKVEEEKRRAIEKEDLIKVFTEDEKENFDSFSLEELKKEVKKIKVPENQIKVFNIVKAEEEKMRKTLANLPKNFNRLEEQAKKSKENFENQQKKFEQFKDHQNTEYQKKREANQKTYQKQNLTTKEIDAKNKVANKGNKNLENISGYKGGEFSDYEKNNWNEKIEETKKQKEKIHTYVKMQKESFFKKIFETSTKAIIYDIKISENEIKTKINLLNEKKEKYIEDFEKEDIRRNNIHNKKILLIENVLKIFKEEKEKKEKEISELIRKTISENTDLIDREGDNEEDSLSNFIKIQENKYLEYFNSKSSNTADGKKEKESFSLSLEVERNKEYSDFNAKQNSRKKKKEEVLKEYFTDKEEKIQERWKNIRKYLLEMEKDSENISTTLSEIEKLDMDQKHKDREELLNEEEEKDKDVNELLNRKDIDIFNYLNNWNGVNKQYAGLTILNPENIREKKKESIQKIKKYEKYLEKIKDFYIYTENFLKNYRKFTENKTNLEELLNQGLINLTSENNKNLFFLSDEEAQLFLKNLNRFDNSIKNEKEKLKKITTLTLENGGEKLPPMLENGGEELPLMLENRGEKLPPMLENGSKELSLILENRGEELSLMLENGGKRLLFGKNKKDKEYEKKLDELNQSKEKLEAEIEIEIKNMENIDIDQPEITEEEKAHNKKQIIERTKRSIEWGKEKIQDIENEIEHVKAQKKQNIEWKENESLKEVISEAMNDFLNVEELQLIQEDIEIFIENLKDLIDGFIMDFYSINRISGKDVIFYKKYEDRKNFEFCIFEDYKDFYNIKNKFYSEKQEFLNKQEMEKKATSRNKTNEDLEDLEKKILKNELKIEILRKQLEEAVEQEIFDLEDIEKMSEKAKDFSQKIQLIYFSVFDLDQYNSFVLQKIRR